MTKIDLKELTRGEVRNLSGHERGVEARNKFNLDELDEQNNIVIVIPDELITMTTSFFQGMFAESVNALGNKEKFLKHYHFNAEPYMLLQIQRGLAAVATSREPFDLSPNS